jgi:putative colanic acid biosynthesis acetyltransferase WcaF
MNNENEIQTIPLKNAPGAREAWSRPAPIVALWFLVEYFLVTNALQPSSRIRAFALRAFGAKIGEGVILRPRLRVKFPWNLEIGADSWIGEGVWIHNQDRVSIGHDVCISQETFITTGSHRLRTDMGLVTKPVVIEPGVWICSRVIVTMGTVIGKNAVIPAGSICPRVVEPSTIWNNGERFE